MTETLAARLEALRMAYEPRLRAQLAEVSEALRRALTTEAPSNGKELWTTIHNLRGTSGSYGFAEVASRLGIAEEALAPHRSGAIPALAIQEALAATSAARATFPRDADADECVASEGRQHLVEFDESAWPIVRATIKGSPDDEHADAIKAHLNRWMARGPFAVLVDGRAAGLPSPKFVRDVRAFRSEARDRLEQRVVAYAAVADSPVSRGVFHLLQVVEAPPYPAAAFDTEDAALRWLRDHLKA